MSMHRHPFMPILVLMLLALLAPAWAAQPTVTITPNSGTTTSNPITFTVTFSESVTGFLPSSSADLTVTNGSFDSFTGSGATYSVVVIPAGDGLVVTVNVLAAAAKNAALEDNLAGSGAVTYNVPPSLGITPSGGRANGATITFTFTFTENVTGFNATDVSVVNGTKGAFNATSASIYTLVVTPTSQGLVTASVASGVAFDAQGAVNSAANASVTYDSIAPTLTITPERHHHHHQSDHLHLHLQRAGYSWGFHPHGRGDHQWHPRRHLGFGHHLLAGCAADG